MSLPVEQTDVTTPRAAAPASPEPEIAAAEVAPEVRRRMSRLLASAYLLVLAGFAVSLVDPYVRPGWLGQVVLVVGIAAMAVGTALIVVGHVRQSVKRL